MQKKVEQEKKVTIRFNINKYVKDIECTAQCTVHRAQCTCQNETLYDFIRVKTSPEKIVCCYPIFAPDLDCVHQTIDIIGHRRRASANIVSLYICDAMYAPLELRLRAQLHKHEHEHTHTHKHARIFTTIGYWRETTSTKKYFPC